MESKRESSEARKRGAQLIVVLGLYWTWTAATFFGMLMFPRSANPLGESELLHLVALSTCAVLTLCIALLRRPLTAGRRRTLALLGCSSASLGSILTLVCNNEGTGLLVVSALVTGVGAALLLYWLCLFVDPAHGVRKTLITFSAALLVSTTLYALLYLIGGVAAAIVNACIPFVILAIVIKNIPPIIAPTGSAASECNAGAADDAKPSEQPASRFPWQLIVGFSIFGVAFGLIRGIPAPNPADVSLYYLVHQLGRAVTGVIVILLASKSKDEYWTVTAFGIVCFGVSFLATYQADSPFMQFVINIASTLGYTCFELLMWAIIFAIVSETNTRFNLTYGLGRGCMQIGTAFGAVLTFYARHSLPENFSASAIQISVVVMMLVILGCFGTRNMSELWGMQKRTLPSAASSDEELQELLSRHHGLSPRECDVATLLAKGRSEPFIAESLFLSRSTVHSHITKIYAKTGVHSRQEFLSLAESLTSEQR